MLKLELEMSGNGRLFLVLSVEERKERVQKWCFFFCVSTGYVFTLCTVNVCISLRRISGEKGMSVRKCDIVL